MSELYETLEYTTEELQTLARRARAGIPAFERELFIQFNMTRLVNEIFNLRAENMALRERCEP